MIGGFRANSEESHKSRLGVADFPHVMRLQFNRLPSAEVRIQTRNESGQRPGFEGTSRTSKKRLVTDFFVAPSRETGLLCLHS